MPNTGKKLAQDFLKSLNALVKEKGDGLQIDDIDALFSNLRGKHHNEVYEGIEQIAEKIDTIKVELSQPHPGVVSSEKFPDAHMELDAVVKAAEDATHAILDSVEKIQRDVVNLDLPEEKTSAIFDEITKIFEACNFQDITGQRVSKVMATLSEVDTAIHVLLEAIRGKVEIEYKEKEHIASDDDLMNGPQHEVPTQDEIDKLFADN